MLHSGAQDGGKINKSLTEVPNPSKVSISDRWEDEQIAMT